MKQKKNYFINVEVARDGSSRKVTLDDRREERDVSSLPYSYDIALSYTLASDEGRSPRVYSRLYHCTEGLVINSQRLRSTIVDDKELTSLTRQELPDAR